MNKVYFGKDGLTSTSANTVANLAKEYVRTIKDKLNSIQLYNTDIELIGGTKTSIEFGFTPEDFAKIPQMLSDIAEAHSLIAWLREALKAKEAADKEINCLTFLEYCKIMGIECPTPPEYPDSLTIEEYMQSLPINQRNRYYYLESQVSVIGKMIHEHGTLSDARIKLSEKVNKPVSVDTNGRDTIIYRYTPSVSEDKVSEMYFELQKKHREYQKQLNSMKYDCDIAVGDSAIKVNSEYQIAVEKYSAEKEILATKYKEFILEKRNEIKALKIVIPDTLKNIYTKVNNLGSK